MTCDPQPGAQLEQPESILDDDLIQTSFQQLKEPPSPLRPRLLQGVVQQLMLPRGRLILVTGQAGQGKTAFLVGISGRRKGCRAEGQGGKTVCILKCKRVCPAPCRHPWCQRYRLPTSPTCPPWFSSTFLQPAPTSVLLSTFSDASVPTCIENCKSQVPSPVLTGAYPEISRLCCLPCFPISDLDLLTYRGLVWELQQRLLLKSAQSLKPGQTLVLIIDGADKLVGQNGQLTSDWVPKSLPRVSVRPGRGRKLERRVQWRCRERDLANAAPFSQRVHLVLSVSSDSGLGETLQQSQDASVVALGPLVPSSRAQLVREELALYGKRLEESPFNNQVGPRPERRVNWGTTRVQLLKPVAASLGLLCRFLQTSLPGEIVHKIILISPKTTQTFPW